MNSTDIKRIADLARLEFSDDEIEGFARQFTNIVDYIGTMNAVDMTGVEPMAHVNEAVNVFRDDVVGECLTTAEALSNAPQKNEAFFKVPKVLG